MIMSLGTAPRRSTMLLLATFLGTATASLAQEPGGERLFCITSSADAIASFEKNAGSVSIIGPQSYRVDAQGNLTGEVPARILEIAKARDIPVMPLIVNPGWNLELFHKLVNDAAARARMIASMVLLGKQHGFWGWQFDFEQIHVSDRDSLSRFYREAAEALHANGMKISIAVYPDPGDLQNASEFHTWLWEYLVGAYDLKALAAAGDFITLMTYLQHTPRTPPGPVGGLPYIERVVRTALAHGVTPQQLSLGIAFFSMHWRTEWNAERKGYSWGRGLSWNAATELVRKAGARLQWDGVQGASYARWENHGVFEYAWIEDARALAPKLDLQKRFHLRGVSVWRIGQEDPAVWKRLTANAAVTLRAANRPTTVQVLRDALSLKAGDRDYDLSRGRPVRTRQRRMSFRPLEGWWRVPAHCLGPSSQAPGRPSSGRRPAKCSGGRCERQIDLAARFAKLLCLL